MSQTKSISIAVLTALFLLCLLAMCIHGQTAENTGTSVKDREIEELKHEIEILKKERDVNKAGINSAAVNILILLLFSAGTGLAAAYFVRKRTKSLCHCYNRKLKLMKKMTA